MWTLHTANPEHWVPLSTVASFKRMRPFSALGIPWLASALRKCSQELEIDESGEMIRRKSEVVEPKGAWERSIYAVSVG
jgi:lupus La protein